MATLTSESDEGFLFLMPRMRPDVELILVDVDSGVAHEARVDVRREVLDVVPRSQDGGGHGARDEGVGRRVGRSVRVIRALTLLSMRRCLKQ